MKKNLFLLWTCIIVSILINTISCASTVKYSPDLTAENAVTLELIHKYYTNGAEATLEITSFDGSTVKWEKNMKILIPEGTHTLGVRMMLTYSNSGWGKNDKFSITVKKGDYYYISCIPKTQGIVEIQFYRDFGEVIKSAFVLQRII